MRIEGIFHSKAGFGVYSDRAFHLLRAISGQVLDFKVKAPGAKRWQWLRCYRPLFCMSFMGPRWTVSETGEVCAYTDMWGAPDKVTLEAMPFEAGRKKIITAYILKALGDTIERFRRYLVDGGLPEDSLIHIEMHEEEAVEFTLADLRLLHTVLSKKSLMPKEEAQAKLLIGQPANMLDAERNRTVKRELRKLQRDMADDIVEATTAFYDRFRTAREMNEHDEEYEEMISFMLEELKTKLIEFGEKYFDKSNYHGVKEHAVKFATALRYV